MLLAERGRREAIDWRRKKGHTFPVNSAENIRPFRSYVRLSMLIHKAGAGELACLLLHVVGAARPNALQRQLLRQQRRHWPFKHLADIIIYSNDQ